MEGKIAVVRKVLQTRLVHTPPDHATVPMAFLDATVAHPALTQTGLRLLHDSKVAVLMVAGGMSTRMGSLGLRGNLPIGPVTGRSIFQLQGEKIAALRQRYAPQMPWLVMTSAAVHEETVRTFRHAGYFGVPSDAVWFFQQASLPVLDAQFTPVRLADGTFLQSPTGHGNMLEALGNSGLLDRMHQQGIEYLFYFQYPNVLERVCDPVMLGYHHQGGFEATTKAIRDYQADEKVGRVVAVAGSLCVVEYHLLHHVQGDAWWHTVPANIATHIWSIAFLERCLRDGVQLPYYGVPHRLSANPEVPLWKVEQFVFDLLPQARTTGLVIVLRAEEYAPVKQSSGPDSLESARAALLRLYRNWLEQAGATPADPECLVEISPLYALDADDVSCKLPQGLRYHDGLVLR